MLKDKIVKEDGRDVEVAVDPFSQPDFAASLGNKKGIAAEWEYVASVGMRDVLQDYARYVPPSLHLSLHSSLPPLLLEGRPLPT